ncbi:hypothetical protein [Pseudostreptobacillus hongkongensis]|uniref:hypothetical protein n=1 Tax=Pseudostreptobacillus hongkongensis TaxID=1162717 RepID=UPI0028D775EE|nr:hypothetical protein [Pseudostreptobacillus hongkongensis]
MKFYDIIDDRYLQEIVVDMAYHSTLIECNTLTKSETRNILLFNKIEIERA